ncbi:hypothetical protein [Xenophilus azovorans]|uniref:hypothetical protein n=1 Tax=Xenophilus azovorans TaxID=151755 RepID=UPI001B802FC7
MFSRIVRRGPVRRLCALIRSSKELCVTRFRELIFIDDIFRGEESGLQPHPTNRRFLRAFFEVAARRLGWDVREVCAESQKGALPVANLLSDLGLPSSPEGWAAACVADLTPGASALASLALSCESLVIGWGMPPSLMRFIHAQGVAFIDVEVYSLRFARHLFLSARTNDVVIRRQLELLRPNDEVFWAAAAGLKGFFARRGQGFILGRDVRVGLFLGQTEVDLALVSGARLARPSDFVDQIAQWAREVDLLAVKAHPYQPDLGQLRQLLQVVPNAALINVNAYELMCAENLQFVGALSSGALKEAPYFGCRDVRQLLQDDRNNAAQLPPSCSPWLPVGPAIASIDALRAFAGVSAVGRNWPSWLPTRRNACVLENGGFADDVLDQIFGGRWGLSEFTEGLPEVPTLRCEQEYRLSAGRAERSWLGAGWHQPEHWGVWSEDHQAILLIPLAVEAVDATASGLEFRLRGRLYRPPGGSTAPKAQVFVNDRSCRERVHDEATGLLEWSVDWDADLIRGPLLFVRVEVSGATSPAAAGESQDERRLGLGLETVDLVSPAAAD